VVSEKPIPGKIDTSVYLPHLQRNATALAALGIKKPMIKLRDLQSGLEVTLPDGTVLQPPPPRQGWKTVILGDTYDPSPISNLGMDCDLLIHEATNAHLPHIASCRSNPGDTYESVEERSKSHGHSTPQMAGAFATRIRAKKLVLNHFSARYAGDDDVNEESAEVMNAIRDLARGTFEDGEVVCARDLMSIDIHRPITK
jgi:ribonuclease Z